MFSFLWLSVHYSIVNFLLLIYCVKAEHWPTSAWFRVVCCWHDVVAANLFSAAGNFRSSCNNAPCNVARWGFPAVSSDPGWASSCCPTSSANVPRQHDAGRCTPVAGWIIHSCVLIFICAITGILCKLSQCCVCLRDKCCCVTEFCTSALLCCY